MPELPEVETVARKLAPQVIGKKVQQIKVLDSKLQNPKYKKLIGLKIQNVFRSGKQIVIELSSKQSKCPGNTFYLCVHLRMTGRLLWQKAGEKERDKHLRLRLNCGKHNLDFVDVRRFGTVKLCSEQREFEPKAIDPTTNEFTKAKLEELIAGSKQEIKTWLLRQDKLIGIGNIYASEILFKACILPNRLASSLSNDELKSLAGSIKSILKKAIKNCGTTFSDFQDSNGEIGNYQNYLKVYQRDGEACKKCKVEVVQKLVQAQRSTFYCQGCQS